MKINPIVIETFQNLETDKPDSGVRLPASSGKLTGFCCALSLCKEFPRADRAMIPQDACRQSTLILFKEMLWNG
jgi:hypothetical protein